MRLKLYLRIWMAIVITVIALTLGVGMAWQNHVDHLRDQMRLQSAEASPTELEVHDDAGKVVGYATPMPRRTDIDAEPLSSQNQHRRGGRAFELRLDNGEILELRIPSRSPRPSPLISPWYFSPFGSIGLLVLIAIAVAIGAYPIVRRLTKRLETLQRGVERWGQGQLSERVPVEGSDEVAFLAQRFNHAATQVEALMMTHKTLLANASHELRSPLARIRMGLELLETAQPQSLGQNMLEIKRNIAELDTLIEEILLASRLDSPNAIIGASESFDLMGLAAEECARTGAELIVADDAQGTFEMLGYPRLIRRLLRNLLENAHRYNTASLGTVSLSLTRDLEKPQMLIITVLDHGIGVADEECERIFEPFYRAKNASERDGGVGLGLALVKTIALRHNGHVACIPTHGKGGRFIVQLATSL